MFYPVSDEGGALRLGDIEVCKQNKNNVGAQSHVQYLTHFLEYFNLNMTLKEMDVYVK